MAQPSILRIIGRHFYRLWYGDPERIERLRAEWAAASAANPYPTLNIDRQTDATKPYNGIPVPMKASISPGADFLGEWDDKWHIVPAKNGQDALVFADTFVAETSTGDVIYNDEDADVCRSMIHSGDWLRRSGFMNGLRKIGSAALQYLSACRHVHAKGIVIISAPAECTWLRPDFSLVGVSLIVASCRQIGVSAGDWSQYHSYPTASFGPGRGRSIDPPYGVAECGQPKTDLFYWACWVHELMTKRKSPVLTPVKEELGVEERRKREQVATEAVERGSFDGWPTLPDYQLGPCLIKAWKGEYDSADDAFQDVKSMLESCGRVFADDEEDELVGFDWRAELGPVKQ